ncbi:hypothetical protein [Hephaestia mangrovi]|uniref:hypothetical protein n=1 Tax=Hephaestia mangrovi TaxID=2873268 RepID=UPI0021035096|nr:hypothetical protein [Hephaestia mangrovi]
MKIALIAAVVALVPAAAFAQTGDAPPSALINAHYTLDTPIKDLIADPGAKAVLDKDLPGLSSDENLSKFEDKSLRELQPMTGGQLTDDLMKKVATDLAATGDPVAAPADGTKTPPVGDPKAPAGR